VGIDTNGVLRWLRVVHAETTRPNANTIRRVRRIGGRIFASLRSAAIGLGLRPLPR
jgi:hypothetical protein